MNFLNLTSIFLLFFSLVKFSMIIVSRISNSLNTIHAKKFILTYGLDDFSISYEDRDKATLALDYASRDKNILGLVIYNRDCSSCYEEMRTIIQKFKNNNKFVSIYSPRVDLYSTYLFSPSQDISLLKNGTSTLEAPIQYFPVNKIHPNVKEEIITTGDFKYTSLENGKLSQIFKEAKVLFLKSKYDIYVSEISKNLQIHNFHKLPPYINNNDLISSSQHLKATNFTNWSNEFSQPKISLKDYMYKHINKINTVTKTNKIAVITLNGPIDESNKACQPSFWIKVQNLIKDPNIKAIILRIDSPGGSADLSYELLSILENISKIKPIIAHVDELCASGAYMAAIGATKIFAKQDATIGSIGVIFSHPYSINGAEIVKATESDTISPFAPLTDDQKQYVIIYLKQTLQNFRNAVSKNRKFASEYTDQISLGQVYTGLDAKKLGLIDENYNFIETIEYIKKCYDLEQYELVYIV
ncbi:MAG: S49 family peptidase [Alphaproteobacteria bacterium]|nr:MAG: S49 family peptidase [Alphaproteobacteria bacterium]